MEDKKIISFLERMEKIIINNKLEINLFKEYCLFLQTLYINDYPIDYLKYAKILDNANIIEPKSKEEWLAYQYFKGNIIELINKLENKKSK